MRLRSRELLAQLVEGTGLSEREVARRAGIGHATLNHLLTARRQSCSAPTALAVSTLLLCPPSALFVAESPRERRALLGPPPEQSNAG